MCGIVGYVGPRDAAAILMDGLARLEYRGYDSAGIAVLNETGAMRLEKRAGKLENLTQALVGATMTGTPGIAHTRWATHGRPNDLNAHPHLDCHDAIAVVHNGIIENYLELRQELTARGHQLHSETDTEVLAHLLEIEMAHDGDLAAAMRRMLPRLRGAYAIVAMAVAQPDMLVGARSDVPLIVGLGTGEAFFASDITAILRYTRRMVTLHDGEVATITPQGLILCRLDGSPVMREPLTVDWDAQMAEKGGYDHFLLKEIMEQPIAVRRALQGRVREEQGMLQPWLEDFQTWVATGKLATIRRIVLLACGTSLYAAQIARAQLTRWARLPVEAVVASEYRYEDPVVGPDVLVIAITQSGETADTIAAVRLARAAGAPVIGITNSVGSALTHEVDVTLYLQAGPEISVPATKTFVASLVVLTLLSLSLARAATAGQVSRYDGVGPSDRELPDASVTANTAEIRDKALSEERFSLKNTGLDASGISAILSELEMVPALMDEDLEIATQDFSIVRQVARSLARCQSVMFIGRGVGQVIASEGALKLKEVSYIHAESYPAGELKHGPIALLDPDTPLVAIATASATYQKIVSNIQEVRARNARIIAVATQGDAEISEHADDVIFVPAIDELLTPLLAIIPLQLMAYYTARERGCAIDQPRNLAKSVTVE